MKIILGTAAEKVLILHPCEFWVNTSLDLVNYYRPDLFGLNGISSKHDMGSFGGVWDYHKNRCCLLFLFFFVFYFLMWYD